MRVFSSLNMDDLKNINNHPESPVDLIIYSDAEDCIDQNINEFPKINPEIMLEKEEQENQDMPPLKKESEDEEYDFS